MLQLIEQKLEELFPPASSLLIESARYSLFPGGKRLRPQLVLATAEAFGAPHELALAPACAIELIHTYSLIHDDLPCMDNDDMRRGKPSLHKAYPEGHAVLTGDFLLTFAFQLLAESPGLSPLQRLDMIHKLALRAGAQGMIGGQSVDLASTGKKIDWQTLQQLHRNKTAALITCALEIGGVIAKTNELQRLQDIGENLGLAFQIIDDLLDAAQEIEKPTAVHLLGKDGATAMAEKLFQSALEQIRALPHSKALEELAHLLVHRAS